MLFSFICSVCPFVLFLLTTVLSVLLRSTESDYPFSIFKLFLNDLSIRLPVSPRKTFTWYMHILAAPRYGLCLYIPKFIWYSTASFCFLFIMSLVCVCMVAANKEATEPSVPCDKNLDHHCESHHHFSLSVTECLCQRRPQIYFFWHCHISVFSSFPTYPQILNTTNATKQAGFSYLFMMPNGL